MQPDSNKPEGANPPKRRKRRHEEEEHEQHLSHDESNWLVSYADMMTLLFGFFVLMYSFSKVDKDKFEIVRKDMVKYFGGQLVEDPGAPAGLTKLLKDMKVGVAATMEKTSEYNVSLQGDTLVLTLSSDLLFASGSAAPSEKTYAVLNKVYQSIKGKKIELIEVEGHTDGDQISTPTFPSNWELSTARASSIVRIFESLKVPSKELKATGFGDSRLLVPEKDEKGQPLPENKNKNRRVVLNFKIDPSNADIKKTLESQGLGVVKPVVNATKPDAPNATTSGSEMQTFQEKYAAMNQKLQEAAARLADAQEKQKKIKELEALSKKTADMEKKISDMEKKTKDTLEKTQKVLNPEDKKEEKVEKVSEKPE